MQKYFELAIALDYIEKHLTENFNQEDIAKAAYISLSSLQKRFRYTFGHSVNEYILKRKMTAAAEELLISDITVSEMAAKYGYSSTEAFSRAFRRINCALPSDYRRGKKSQAVFTPLKIGENGITREIPVLIDAIHKSESCYVICFDIVDMIPINEISREAGELAIIKAVQRIHQYSKSEMPLFRIGGDEFALITFFNDAKDAEQIVTAVLSHNGEAFEYKEMFIPLYIRSWYGKNSFAKDAANPAKLLKEKVKYHGFTEVLNDRQK